MGGSNAKDFFGRSILVRSLVSVSWREHMIRFGELTWGKKIVNISQKYVEDLTMTRFLFRYIVQSSLG